MVTEILIFFTGVKVNKTMYQVFSFQANYYRLFNMYMYITWW